MRSLGGEKKPRVRGELPPLQPRPSAVREERGDVDLADHR